MANQKWAWRRSPWDSSELLMKQCVDQSEHWHRYNWNCFSNNVIFSQLCYVAPPSGRLFYFYWYLYVIYSICMLLSAIQAPACGESSGCNWWGSVGKNIKSSPCNNSILFFAGERPRYVSACTGMFRGSRRAARMCHRTNTGHENCLHTQVPPPCCALRDSCQI